METKKNILKFSTFKQKRDKSFKPLPFWFNEKVYREVLDYLNCGQKLQACKYLCDMSTLKKTRDQYDLKWSKVEVADEIDSLGGGNYNSNFNTPTPTIAPTPTKISAQEIMKVLHPFMKMAGECKQNKYFHAGQVLFSYNNAQITIEDLNNVEVLQLRLLNEKL